MKPAKPRLASVASWLRVKRNMIIAGVAIFGVPLGFCLAWRFGGLRGEAFGFILFALSLLGGALWGFLMWHCFGLQFPSMRDDTDANRKKVEN